MDIVERRRSTTRLGEILLSQGLISRDELAQILNRQAGSQRKLGELLLASHKLSANQIASALGKQHRYWAAISMLVLGILHPVHTLASEDKTGYHMNQITSAGYSNFHQHKPRAIDKLASLLRRKAISKPLPPPAKPVITDEIASVDLPDIFHERIAAILPMAKQASVDFNVPIDLLLGVMHAESAFDCNAKSRMNAYGLMQLIPQSGGAEAYRLVYGKPGVPSIHDLLEPETNIRLGAAYLKSLNDGHFHEFQDDKLRRSMVITAYNLGPTRIKNLFKKYGKPDSIPDFVRILNYEAPKETIHYLHRVQFRSGLYAHINTDDIKIADQQTRPLESRADTS